MVTCHYVSYAVALSFISMVCEFNTTEVLDNRLCLAVCRGFTNSRTAFLMLKRAQKMKATKKQQKKHRSKCVVQHTVETVTAAKVC